MATISKFTCRPVFPILLADDQRNGRQEPRLVGAYTREHDVLR